MAAPSPSHGARLLAAGLLFASGFSAIAYQILWVQQSGLWLGQESAAVVAVVAAFLAGLALGSLLVARAVERAQYPARWYAACELAVALWACVLVFSQAPVDGLLSAWTGEVASPFKQWAVSFGGTLLLLLPATVAMGATLPAMERCVRGLGKPGAFSLLYAANTGGAMAGALAAAFWLVPHFGLLRTALCCGAINLACAMAALLLPKQAVSEAPTATLIAESGSPGSAKPDSLVLPVLFATGWLGIGFELLVVRALSQVAENTVYTFALILAVYLGGAAIGAGIHAAIVTRFTAAGWRQVLLSCLAVVTALTVPVLGNAVPLHAWLIEHLPDGVGGALAAEALLAVLVFLPGTLFMGLTFPQLVDDAKRAGIPAGKALAANTLGGCFAPLFTLVLLPLWGLRTVLLLLSAAYLLPALRGRTSWVAGGVVVLVAALAPPLQFANLAAGDRLLVETEGRQATVSVLEKADGTRTLHIDNRQQEGSNRTTYADGRQALLPLVLHPQPRTALFLGVGTGVTSAVATLDPKVQVDAVELLPEVVAATQWFAEAVPEGSDLERRRFIVADARRWVRAGTSHYDLVVADNFHPARSGTGALYSREHFAAVKQRLSAGGLFCQWLPLHQLDIESLASVVRSFQSVFPDAVVILATNSLDTPTLGLVGFRDGRFPNEAELGQRLNELPAGVRNAFDLPDAIAVAGTVVAESAALQTFAANAVANTDDRPVVAYRAPFVTYAAEMAPRDRLLKVIDEWAGKPSQAKLAAASGHVWNERVARYRQARNLYLHIGRDVRPVAGLQAMLAQVREPLFAVLRISPDFSPAFVPLSNMAQALAQEDPAAGEQMLMELREIAATRNAVSGSR